MTKIVKLPLGVHYLQRRMMGKILEVTKPRIKNGYIYLKVDHGKNLKPC